MCSSTLVLAHSMPIVSPGLRLVKAEIHAIEELVESSVLAIFACGLVGGKTCGDVAVESLANHDHT